MVEDPQAIVFQEVQKPNQLWLRLLIYGLAFLIWYGFIQQIIFGQPFGPNPAPDWVIGLIWLLIGIGLPLLWHFTKLVVEVREDHLSVRYIPFISREIPLADIVRYEARAYHPIREYGGWGIRWWFGQRYAYNVSGNQGVELELNTGEKIMIGSQKPAELAEAIASQKQQ